MAPDSLDGPIGGREDMEPRDHPRAIEGRRIPSMANGGHRGPCMTHTSFLVYSHFSFFVGQKGRPQKSSIFIFSETQATN